MRWLLISGINIKLSLRSQQLIKQYCFAGQLPKKIKPRLNLALLLSWLNDELILGKVKPQTLDLTLISLQAELLHDLFIALDKNGVVKKDKDEILSRLSNKQFLFLTGAGILVAACQGFDGIVTMLSVFTLPSAIIIGVGLIFSLVSIAVFCGFDLVKATQIIGVKPSETYQLLDLYLQQLNLIKVIRKKIDTYCLTELSPKDLKQLELILCMLQKRFSSLVQAGQQFELALNSKGMFLAKTLISAMSAILFFGGGFFAGQSVALFISGLMVNTALAAFAPVTFFSTLVGFAALSIYWYVERPELNKLVSNWFGLNEDGVAKLSDKELIAKEEIKINTLKEKINSAIRLTNKVHQEEQDGGTNSFPVSSRKKTTQTTSSKISTNFHSFLKSSPIFSNMDELSSFKTNSVV